MGVETPSQEEASRFESEEPNVIFEIPSDGGFWSSIKSSSIRTRCFTGKYMGLDQSEAIRLWHSIQSVSAITDQSRWLKRVCYSAEQLYRDEKLGEMFRMK